MPRRLTLVCLAALCTLGCRADEGQCEALAAHVGDLAAAEGKPGASLKMALERDCKLEPPSRALAKCMLDASSLAEVQAC